MPEACRCPRRKRQGPRALRARRRAPAAHRQRPHLGLRRRLANRDPRQGPRADRALGLLVRPHGGDRPQPPADDPGGRQIDGVQAPRDAPDRVRRARLPLRVGLEELPGEGRGLRDRTAGGASRVGPASGADLHPDDEGRRGTRRAADRRAGGRTSSATSGSPRPSGSRSSCTAPRPSTRPARGSSSPTRSSSSGSTSRETLVLGDEAFTPDSSRFWPADEYEPGGPQPSYDKQFVRDYAESLGWDKTPPGPELPDEVVTGTRARYLEAFEQITGIPFGDYATNPQAVLR